MFRHPLWVLQLIILVALVCILVVQTINTVSRRLYDNQQEEIERLNQ